MTELEYSSLNDLANQVHQLAVNKGWYDPPKTFTESLMKIVGELSEAEDEFAHGHDFSEIYYVGGKPEGIPIEMADAVIRFLDTCAFFKIDIDAAVKLKHSFNTTRGYRHGGKLT